MDVLVIFVFLMSVLLGSYVQSVTGFALGMIVIAVVAGAQLISIPVITAVASLMALVNVVLALPGHVHEIQKRLFIGIAAGQVPAIWLGVWLQGALDANAQQVLQFLLGAFVTLGSLSMMIRPEPRPRLSSPVACVGAGVAGGVLGGMFSASSPVMGWFNYRQPLSVAEIRATILACFAVTTSTRTLVVGLDGGLTMEVWRLTLLALPVAVLGTWAGREFKPPLSDQNLKRVAFGILLIMGVVILGSAVL